MRTIKLLIYADVNLNIMDGSSVWLAELLGLISKDPRVQLDFLSKAPHQGGPLNGQVDKLANINRIEKSTRPMKLEQAAEAISTLDKENNYDRVLVRGNIELGKALVKFLAGRLVYYTLEPFQRRNELTIKEKVEVSELLNATAFAIVQSERMLESYSKEFDLPREQIYVLPPLIPPIMKRPMFRNQFNSVCYTGKFSEEWGTPGLIDFFKLLKEKLPYAKLNIAGNKFHGKLGGRKEEVKSFFETEESVNWVGEVSRQESIHLSRNSDIGYALRSTEIDNDESQELSTKLFEYMSAGKPVILRPTIVHKALLGEKYPLFANSVEEAAEKCSMALSDITLYQIAAKMSYEAYEKFAEKVNQREIVERLLDYQKPTILFVGHDLKFIEKVIEEFKSTDDFEVLVDKWSGHTQHNEAESKRLLEKADYIFCEWGLGNIRWYSKHKRKGQKLVVRVHRQEIQRLDYLEDSIDENIDNYIFIAPYRYEEFVEKLNLSRVKAKMIFNYVDDKALTTGVKKSDGYTLGLVGIVPWGKRLDKAIELLEMLWKVDKRFKLRVKGKKPQELPWMLNKNHEEEMKRYDRLFKTIDNAAWRDNVIFDPHGNDMAEWYTRIDYILSMSDYEGSHQAVAEGMASGAIPIILPWSGAETVYPKKYLFEGKLKDFEISQLEKDKSKAIIDYAKQHFTIQQIQNHIRELIE
ncbi:glycosyltransferase [Alteromonas genovensis]|uniref:glycosyltransferase n=1 Tax=Alteromonas genovensis TaxID=471225 RepID=UPI002FE0A01A